MGAGKVKIKRSGLSTAARRSRQRDKLWAKDSRCWSCGGHTVLPKNVRHKPCARMATTRGSGPQRAIICLGCLLVALSRECRADSGCV